MAGSVQKILAVHYDFSEKHGECRSVARAGVNGVKEIGEHMPQGPGDCHFYDVVKTDGSRERIFNMVRVEYSTPMKVTPVTGPGLIVP